MRHALGVCLLLALGAQVPAQAIENFAFELEKLGGGTVRASDFKENILIVDLWGTWCGPCKEAVPHLQRLYGKYKHYGLEIVGVNYERGPRDQQLSTARKFAAEHGITYPLALGDPGVQRQVPDFRGYPTLLLFDKGVKFNQLHVGFEAGQEKDIERWIRQALELPAEEGKPAQVDAGSKAGGKDVAEEQIAEEEGPPKSDVPAGAIFKPGDGDKGFDFEAKDLEGKDLKFKDLRGKVVFLALTTTWDSEAVNTAALLNKLHAAAGEKAHVVAASFERAADEAAKVGAIKEFAAKQQILYRAFPASLGFNKKIHLFSGVPLFLAFDAEGTLVLRESGLDAELFDRLSALIR